MASSGQVFSYSDTGERCWPGSWHRNQYTGTCFRTGHAHRVSEDGKIEYMFQDAGNSMGSRTFSHLTRHSVTQLAAKARYERRLHNPKLVRAQCYHSTDKPCETRPNRAILHHMDKMKPRQHCVTASLHSRYIDEHVGCPASLLAAFQQTEHVSAYIQY